MAKVSSPESNNPTFQKAQQAFHPSRFDFQAHGNGWIRQSSDGNATVYTPLSWQHAQSHSYNKNQTSYNCLEFIVQLQKKVWGMPDSEVVPSNVFSIIEATGGAAIVAYDPQAGFNPDGWKGFVFGFGSRSGALVSHMAGVKEELRGANDTGWYLKIVQAHEALKTGHHTISWTYDPMRGPNARLNLEKLGGVVEDFTIDKYGPIPSELYGQVPSDRFTVKWDLLNPLTHQRMDLVRSATYRRATPSLVEHLISATPDTLDIIMKDRPLHVAYEIPGDIDQLMKESEGKANQWRQEMRTIFSCLMSTEQAYSSNRSPAHLSVTKTEGPYIVTGFATGNINEERKSYYILTRK